MRSSTWFINNTLFTQLPKICCNLYSKSRVVARKEVPSRHIDADAPTESCEFHPRQTIFHTLFIFFFLVLSSTSRQRLLTSRREFVFFFRMFYLPKSLASCSWKRGKCWNDHTEILTRFSRVHYFSIFVPAALDFLLFYSCILQHESYSLARAMTECCINEWKSRSMFN